MKKRRTKRKRMTQVLIIVGAVFVVVIIVAAVILLLRSLKTLKSITLTPNFAETELDVDQDYVFTIKANPSKANLKSLKYNVDDATASFGKGSGSETTTAILHTGAEGTVTLYVNKDKVKSNVLTFQVIDQARKAEEEAAAAEKAAQEAQLAAEAAAQEMQEAEAATMVMVTGDNVRMRAEPNTDCEIVKTCKKGETYTKIETVDDWTKIDNGGRECYIKTEFLKEVTAEEADQAQAEITQEQQDTAEADKKKEEKKKEEEKKKTEETQKNNNDQAAADAAAKAAADAAAKAAADAEAKAKADAEAAAKAQAEAEAAAQAAAAAAAAASAGSVTINCADGPAQFSKAEYDYFVATWNYTGMPEEMMTHHSAAELHQLYNNTH